MVNAFATIAGRVVFKEKSMIVGFDFESLDLLHHCFSSYGKMIAFAGILLIGGKPEGAHAIGLLAPTIIQMAAANIARL